MAENEHVAAHAVTAEVADEAKHMAEEAKEVAEDAQQAAHVALEQSADAAVTPAVEVTPVAKEEEEVHDKSDQILEQLTHIGSRLDEHESRFAELTKPPEPEPQSDVIEVETEPEKPKEKAAPKKETPTDDTGKEGTKNEHSGKAASSRHRFGRPRT